MGKFIDLTGRKFTWWTVVSRRKNQIRPSGGVRAQWLCECKCGVRKIINGGNLLQKISTSCGCRKRMLTIKRCTKHGHTAGGKTSPEYYTWHSIKRRTTDPNDKNYKHYMGRGIKMCQRWINSFETFLADVGRKPKWARSLDRIDNDGNYEPGNVRWATQSQQTRNTRKSISITYNGRTQNIRDWAEEIGMSPDVLYARIRVYGYSVEEAMTKPIGRWAK